MSNPSPSDESKTNKEHVGAIQDVGDTQPVRIAEQDRELQRRRNMKRAVMFLNYMFFLLYGLIAMEIVLELFGAREESQFKVFLDTITAPFLAPFHGLLFDPQIGPFRLMLSFIFAMFFYFLVHMALRGFLRLIAHPVD